MSLKLKSYCAVQVFVSEALVRKLGNYKIPAVISNTSVLELLLSKLRMVDIEEHASNPCSVVSLLAVIKEEFFRHLNTVHCSLYLNSFI